MVRDTAYSSEVLGLIPTMAKIFLFARKTFMTQDRQTDIVEVKDILGQTDRHC